MIKAIIFDFDGVIVESADIKTEAFKEVFSAYPDKFKEIIDYHLNNGGISRYIKFRYIYEQILQQELLGEAELELGKRFSEIVLQKVLDAPFVAGAEGFLNAHKNRYQFFIVSGTPEEELHRIIQARGLKKCFQGIYGSPREKTDLVNGIIEKRGFARDEVVYVGDAESDSIAARDTGITFIERRAKLDRRCGSYPLVIKDLNGLNQALEQIELQKMQKIKRSD